MISLKLLEVLDKLEENATSDSLQEIFCDSVTSDYIVVYLRLIVSCYLQKNEEFFQCFIENYTTIKDFCIHVIIFCFYFLIINFFFFLILY